MMDKRKGIAFQNFVAQVEKAFAARDTVTIETSKFITDIDSGIGSAAGHANAYRRAKLSNRR